MHARTTIRRILAVLVLAASCACALQPNRALSRYGRATWNSENGLPQNTVHRVLQSSDGFIWLATDGGLARFDGVDFAIFDKRSATRLPDEHVRDIIEDRSGAIWVATPKGVVRLQRNATQTFTIEQGLPSDDVSSLALDSQGTIYAFTAGGIASFSEARFATTNGPSPDVNCTTHDRNGALLVGTSKGIDRISRGAVEHVVNAIDVRSIAVTDNGEIWFISRIGLQVFGRGKLDTVAAPESFVRGAQSLLAVGAEIWVGSGNGVIHVDAQRRVTTLDARNGLPNNSVTALYADRSGAVWIGTARGVGRFTAGRVEAISPREGFAANSITGFLEDREGSMWIGTETSGVALLRDRNFVTYTTRDGLADDNITSLTQDANGTVWLGSSGGGLSAWRDGKVSTYSSTNGMASDFVLALAADRNGAVWIGTPDGLNVWRGGRAQLYSTADGLADDFVRSVLVARDGAVWVGTRRGLSVLRNGVWTTYTTDDGLPNNYVGVLLQDADGTLWIGTRGGLSHFHAGKFTNYTSELSSNAVTALHQDAANDLWIGTNGGSLDLMRNGTFFHPKNGAQLPDVIFGILEDAGKNLWLSSPQGVVRVSGSPADAIARGEQVKAEWYGTSDGMETRECSGTGHPSSIAAADGTLWFATVRGASSVDANHLAINRVPPLIAVEQATVDDVLLPSSEPVQLAPGNHRLVFHFAALSFVAPQKVRYKYRLEGFDRDWIDADNRREASYTNLSAGRYRFRVMAANNDGVWSESSADFPFYQRPHFYRTLWFYALCVAVAGLLAYQLYRMRLRRMQSQFNVVLAERTRIARDIHDTLAQDFIGISVQLELLASMLNISVEAAKAQLDQARASVREAVANARRSVWSLRSQALDGGDLPSAISETLRQATQNSGIKASFETNGTYRTAPVETEDQLLRIAQEAISNAVRHSAAERLEVRLQYSEHAVRLRVQDDGRGFDTTARRNGHFGLVGMRERAQQIGAQLDVASAAGEGTIVSVEVRIKENIPRSQPSAAR